MLEEKNAEVEHYRNRMERMQREYEERLHGTATELQRLQLEKTLLQVRPTVLQSALDPRRIACAAASCCHWYPEGIQSTSLLRPCKAYTCKDLSTAGRAVAP